MKFFSVQIKDFIEVPDNEVEMITMKNGKKAAKASCSKKWQRFKII